MCEFLKELVEYLLRIQEKRKNGQFSKINFKK